MKLGSLVSAVVVGASTLALVFTGAEQVEAVCSGCGLAFDVNQSTCPAAEDEFDGFEFDSERELSWISFAGSGTTTVFHAVATGNTVNVVSPDVDPNSSQVLCGTPSIIENIRMDGFLDSEKTCGQYQTGHIETHGSCSTSFTMSITLDEEDCGCTPD